MPSITPPLRYSVFLSYKRDDNYDADRQWADWVKNALEHFKIPKKLIGQTFGDADPVPRTLVPVFQDAVVICAGFNLEECLQDGLDHSGSMIVITSPRTARSEWVAREIRRFKERGKSHRVFVLVIEGQPKAVEGEGAREGATPEEECFPHELRWGVADPKARTPEGFPVINWEQRAEPSWVDVRPGNTRAQGFTTADAYCAHLKRIGEPLHKVEEKVADYAKKLEDARHKLIAGILGVPKAEIHDSEAKWLRAEARKYRRLVYLLVACLLCAMLLACYAVHQGKQALRAQHNAESARQEAVSARGLAERNTVLARRQTDRAEAATDFLFDFLVNVNSGGELGRDPTMLRLVLDQARGRLEAGLADENEAQVAVELLTTIGWSYYRALGDAETAGEIAKVVFSRSNKLSLGTAPALHLQAAARWAGHRESQDELLKANAEFQQALAEYSLQLTAAGEDRQGRKARPEAALAQLHLDYARLLVELKERDDAERELNAAIGVASSIHHREGIPKSLSLRAGQTLARGHMLRGELLRKDDDHVQARLLEQENFKDSHIPLAAPKGIGESLFRLGEFQEAAVHLRDELRLEPKAPQPNYNYYRVSALQDLLARTCEVLRGVEELQEARELREKNRKEAKPQDLPLRREQLADLLARRGEFAAASKVFAGVEISAPRSYELRDNEVSLGAMKRAVLLCKGDKASLPEYDNLRRMILQVWPETIGPIAAERLAKACLLRPVLVADQAVRIQKLIEIAAPMQSERGALNPWLHLLRGLSGYRLAMRLDPQNPAELKERNRHLEEARASLALINPEDPNVRESCEVAAGLLAGLCFDPGNGGGRELDRAQFEHAVKKFDETWKNYQSKKDFGTGWNDWLIASFLREELKEREKK
jgi:hypothetical protein